MGQTTIPQHIAIIADGNRRWARSHGLAVIQGHENAVERTFEPLIRHAATLGVKYLTFWVFSTENWKRSPREIELLMQLFRAGFEKKITLFTENNVKLRIIGDITRFPSDVQDQVKKAVAATSQNTGITVIFAMNYGGRDELVRAVSKLVLDQEKKSEPISIATISKYLDTDGIPDPDLIIRTGGEQRLSGFMLWQCEYSELCFSEVLYPDFTPTELDRAIAEYEQRQRRFGG